MSTHLAALLAQAQPARGPTPGPLVSNTAGPTLLSIFGSALVSLIPLGAALLGAWIGFRAAHMSAEKTEELQRKRFERDDVAALLQAEVAILDAASLAEGDALTGHFSASAWERRFERLRGLDSGASLARAFATPIHYRAFLLELSRIDRILAYLLVDLSERRIESEAASALAAETSWGRRHSQEWKLEIARDILREWRSLDTRDLLGTYFLPALRRALFIVRRELRQRNLVPASGFNVKSENLTIPDEEETMLYGYGLSALESESQLF